MDVLDFQVEVFSEFDIGFIFELFECMLVENVVNIFYEVFVDDVVDIMGVLSEEYVVKFLEVMCDVEFNEVEDFMGYDLDMVGGIMFLDFFVFYWDMIVLEVIVVL